MEEKINQDDVKISKLQYLNNEYRSNENFQVNSISSRPPSPINGITYLPQEVANDTALNNTSSRSRYTDAEGQYYGRDTAEIIGPSVVEDMNSSGIFDEEDGKVTKELSNDNVLQGSIVASRSGIALSDTGRITEGADLQPTSENPFDNTQLNLGQSNGQDSTPDASPSFSIGNEEDDIKLTNTKASSNAIDNIIQNGASLSWFGAVYEDSEAQSELLEEDYGDSVDADIAAHLGMGTSAQEEPDWFKSQSNIQSNMTIQEQLCLNDETISALEQETDKKIDATVSVSRPSSSLDLLGPAEEYNAQQENMIIRTQQSSHAVPTQGIETSVASHDSDSIIAHHSVQSSVGNKRHLAYQPNTPI